MNANEENKRIANELKDGELKEVAGGGNAKCYCSTCKRYFNIVLETCPQCQWDGVKSYVIPV